jgi:hypothetical protein
MSHVLLLILPPITQQLTFPVVFLALVTLPLVTLLEAVLPLVVLVMTHLPLVVLPLPVRLPHQVSLLLLHHILVLIFLLRLLAALPKTHVFLV